VALEHERGAEPSGTFRATLRPTAELDVQADPRCKANQVRVELEGELVSGRLHAELGAFDREKRLLRAGAEAELAVAPALAGGSPALGRIHAELATRDLDLATLPLICGRASGQLTAQAEVTGPLSDRPELSAELSAKRFSMGTPETVDLELRASATRELVKADLALTAKQGRSTLAARVPLAHTNGRVGIDANAPLALDLELRSLPIAPFLPPSGEISYASGTVGGSVHAKGKLTAPDVRGEITLNDIAFTATDLAQPVHQVRGTLSFTQDSLKIKNFVAHDRDGVLKIDGGARLEGGKQLNVAFEVAARDFPIRQQGQVVATTEIDAKVKAKIQRELSEITIDLGAVDMWIESLDIRTGIGLEEHADFTIDGKAPKRTNADEPAATEELGDEPSRAAAARPQGAPPARAKTVPNERLTLLELNAHERIWIKRDDFAVKIGAKLNTEIAGNGARVKGKVSLLRGYLTLMGKDFDIQKGSTLTFTGSARPDPVLDITALHQNRRSGESVSVVITGRAQKPILTFKVDDKEVSAGEAFQAIYGSQLSNQDPKAADAQAKAFVGGLTAGLLATTARRELGAAAPIIMIEPGSQAGSGRVRAGFEFDSLVPNFLKDVITGVYFEGIVSNESPEGAKQSDARTEAGVLLEFYFPRNFFTSGQYGPGPTWSMDVGWQL
jgi:autotransporter translocation and assembly factor TamB